jgi:hypothetical protein
MKYAKQVCLQHTCLWSIQIIQHIIDKDTEEAGHSLSLAIDCKDILHIVTLIVIAQELIMER